MDIILDGTPLFVGSDEVAEQLFPSSNPVLAASNVSSEVTHQKATVCSNRMAFNRIEDEIQKEGKQPGLSKFMFDDARVFKIRESVFSIPPQDGGYLVRNVRTGEVIFKINGRKGISEFDCYKAKPIVGDSAPSIYNLDQKVASLHGRAQLVDVETNGSNFVVRKRSIFPTIMSKPGVRVWSGDKESGAPYFVTKGDLHRKIYCIERLIPWPGSQVLAARVLRASEAVKFQLGSSVTLEKEDYVVIVEPGTDTALMVLLAVIIDEYY